MQTEQDETDLGGGLTTDELYWWAARKREQNMVCRSLGHENFCPRCKNCLCNKWQTGMFRCMCEFGKTMATPYRIRYWNMKDRARYGGY